MLFLQVCGKASVEPAYAVASSARVTLASQLPLAAPNTWYEPGLKAIGAHPEWGGAQWAEAIATVDAPAMSASYTCIDNEKLLRAGRPQLTLSEEDLEGPLASVTWPYADEVYVDLGAALRLAGQPPLEVSCGTWVSAAPPAGLTDGFPSPSSLSGLSVAVERPGQPIPGALSADGP